MVLTKREEPYTKYRRPIKGFLTLPLLGSNFINGMSIQMQIRRKFNMILTDFSYCERTGSFNRWKIVVVQCVLTDIAECCASAF